MPKLTIEKSKSEIFGGAKMVQLGDLSANEFAPTDIYPIEDIIHMRDIVHNRGSIRAFPTKRFRT